MSEYDSCTVTEGTLVAADSLRMNEAYMGTVGLWTHKAYRWQDPFLLGFIVGIAFMRLWQIGRRTFRRYFR